MSDKMQGALTALLLTTCGVLVILFVLPYLGWYEMSTTSRWSVGLSYSVALSVGFTLGQLSEAAI